eukprot:1793043-Rhodomonas_salina.1
MHLNTHPSGLVPRVTFANAKQQDTLGPDSKTTFGVLEHAAELHVPWVCADVLRVMLPLRLSQSTLRNPFSNVRAPTPTEHARAVGGPCFEQAAWMSELRADTGRVCEQQGDRPAQACRRTS